MTLRPVDTDRLAEICRSIALDNYGFLYVDKVKDRIRSEYESANTGLINASSLSTRDIKEALQSIAGNDFTEFEQLRSGVYYYDPFSTGNDDVIADDLTALFGQRLVVTSEELRSRFDVAIDDLDVFVSELTDLNLVRRIATGERDYFTIGPRLKEQTGEAGVDTRLRREAVHGKISHDDLERVINVSATADVIRYLDGEGFIVDLDGEYLVESAIDEYGAYLAGEIGDSVAEEFESMRYVLPEGEFESVLTNELEARFDVLGRVGRDTERAIVDETRAALEDDLGLEADRDVIVRRGPFDDYVEGEARRIKEEIEAEAEQLPARPSEYLDHAADRLDELHPTTAEAANRYIRDGIEERFEAIVRDEFEVEPDG